MADEFTFSSGFAYANGVRTAERKQQSYSVDQATSSPKKTEKIISIGTSEEDIDFGEVSAAGFCELEMMSSSNYVEWGPKSGGAMVKVGKIMPGDPPAQLRLASGVVIRAKADTAACDVLLRVFDL